MKSISNIVCLTISFLIISLSFVRAQALDGERVLPETFTESQCIDVMINFSFNNQVVLDAVMVKEFIPAGWTYLHGSASEEPDKTEGIMEWLFMPLLNREVPERLSYTVCPYEEECSDAAFYGEIMYTEWVPISGDAISSFSCDSPVMKLRAGLNFVSAAYLSNENSAFEVLRSIGDETVIYSIERFNTDTGMMDRAYYENGWPAGIDFEIKAGEGYFIYMNSEMQGQGLAAQCPCGSTDWVLSSGMNLVSAGHVHNGMTAYQILQDFGGKDVVSSIQRFNTKTGKFETAGYHGVRIVGVDFPLLQDEGYIIYMK